MASSGSERSQALPSVSCDEEDANPFANVGRMSVEQYFRLLGPPKRPLFAPDDKLDILYPTDRMPSITPRFILEHLDGQELPASNYTFAVSVSRIGNLLVKANGRHVTHELQNMLFVKQNCPAIPVPEVHVAFVHANVAYIVMDLIEGADIQQLWRTFDDERRQAIVSQAATYANALRSIPVPPGTPPGPLGGGRCEGDWFTDFGAGPFNTTAELISWWNRKLPGDVSRRLPLDCCLVFTHQDISPRNLVLDASDRLWMIDWELAGWYPDFLEYACAAMDLGSTDHPVPKDWTTMFLHSVGDFKEQFDLLTRARGSLDMAPFAE